MSTGGHRRKKMLNRIFLRPFCKSPSFVFVISQMMIVVSNMQYTLPNSKMCKNESSTCWALVDQVQNKIVKSLLWDNDP